MITIGLSGAPSSPALGVTALASLSHLAAGSVGVAAATVVGAGLEAALLADDEAGALVATAELELELAAELEAALDEDEAGAVVGTGAALEELAAELDELAGALVAGTAVGGAAVGTGVGAGAQAAIAAKTRSNAAVKSNSRFITSPPRDCVRTHRMWVRGATA